MFTADTFQFLTDLRANNSKEWFEANRKRYEAHGKGPLTEFVRAMGPHLAAISPHYVANESKQGGSAFRIFRDVRFSKDKSPYKTHLAAQFRHAAVRGSTSETVHAPGFYAHISPPGTGEMDGCFGGFGMWQPEPPHVLAIRNRIVAQPEQWAAARAGLTLVGQSLKRPPAGFDPAHPHAEDLRRKDFISVENFEPADVMRPDFPARYAAACTRTAPLMRFLCQSVGLDF